MEQVGLSLLYCDAICDMEGFLLVGQMHVKELETFCMTWPEVERKWMDVSEHFRETFSDVLPDDLNKSGGEKHKLVATLRERSGHTKEEAELRLEEWRQSLGEDGKVPTSTSGASTY
jgi:uncharacterized protein YjbJ (UPF0337 family)